MSALVIVLVIILFAVLISAGIYYVVFMPTIDSLERELLDISTKLIDSEKLRDSEIRKLTNDFNAKKELLLKQHAEQKDDILARLESYKQSSEESAKKIMAEHLEILAGKQKIIDGLEVKLAESTKKLDKKLSELSESNIDLQDDFDTYKDQYMYTQANIDDLEQQITDIKDNFRLLRIERDDIQKAYEDYVKANPDTVLSNLTKENDNLRNELRDYKALYPSDKFNELVSKNTELENKYTEYVMLYPSGKFDKLKRENDKLSADFETYRQTYSEHEFESLKHKIKNNDNTIIRLEAEYATYKKMYPANAFDKLKAMEIEYNNYMKLYPEKDYQRLKNADASFQEYKQNYPAQDFEKLYKISNNFDAYAKNYPVDKFKLYKKHSEEFNVYKEEFNKLKENNKLLKSQVNTTKDEFEMSGILKQKIIGTFDRIVRKSDIPEYVEVTHDGKKYKYKVKTIQIQTDPYYSKDECYAYVSNYKNLKESTPTIVSCRNKQRTEWNVSFSSGGVTLHPKDDTKSKYSLTLVGKNLKLTKAFPKSKARMSITGNIMRYLGTKPLGSENKKNCVSRSSSYIYNNSRCANSKDRYQKMYWKVPRLVIN